MKKYIIFIIILLFYYSLTFAHSNKVKYTVLIDTDAAADDLRTICLLLSSDEIKVSAITTSDGALTPYEGLVKVRALLRSFGHDGIPTGSGKNTQSNPPQWRELSKNIFWGDEHLIDTNINKNASEIMISSIYAAESPITVICLGSLTNIATAILKKLAIRDGIERIIWYNNNIHPNAGTNYEIDKEAAEYIINMRIQLDVVNSIKGREISFTRNLFKSIEGIQTPYAKAIEKSHNQKKVYKMIETNHFKIWDDLVALYLLYPELFETKTFEMFPNHSTNSISQIDKVEDKIVEILSKEDDTRIVFKHFPFNLDIYRYDVNKYMNQIIENHGKEEWEIVVLTNEFHTHLGVYSTIGAKMGLRAREYFKIGLDELQIVSYAGNRPPISCLNDGLQVSTGATLGHGTIITMTEDLLQQPKAIFTYKNNTISLELKQDYWGIIRKDIKRGIKQHGSLTNDYWLFVRELAIRYWLEWSRKEIFNLEIIN